MKRCPYCKRDFDRYTIDFDMIRTKEVGAGKIYTPNINFTNVPFSDISTLMMTLMCPACNTILSITHPH